MRTGNWPWHKNRGWAETQRRRITNKTLPPGRKVTAKALADIAKLERKLEKLDAKRPVHPYLEKRSKWDVLSEQDRANILEYYSQKRTRRTLAAVAARFLRKADWRPASRWYSILAGALQESGLPIREYEAYPKLKGRKHTAGITPESYVRHLPKYCGLSSKPHKISAGRMDYWGSPEQKLKSYQDSRAAYLAAFREAANLKTLIATLKANMGATVPVEVEEGQQALPIAA